jgi:hypothetical protein
VVIDTGPKKYDQREHSSEWMQKSVKKRFDRADVVRDVRLARSSHTYLYTAPVNSYVVNKAIRRLIWPLLREAGFTQFTARYAWRYATGKIDVVNFQSFNSYLADGLRCTTFSFSVNLGCSFDAIPKRATVERINGYLRPREWECHFRLRLQKTISQPELQRTDIWYVDPSEQNLEIVIEDAKRAIMEIGLPWFDRFRATQEVLRTPSPIRHLMIGYAALSLGQTEIAVEHIQAALLSGCFKDLEPKMRATLEESNRG